MMGFLFERKVRKVIYMHFGHSVPSIYNDVLKEVSKQAIRDNVNEFDAAIMYMIVIMNNLSKSQDTKEFIRLQCKRVESLVKKTKSSPEDILVIIRDIRIKHGIEIHQILEDFKNNSDRLKEIKKNNFRWWYRTFKKSCAQHNEQLVIREDGSSYIDLLEVEDLRKDFNNQLDPYIKGQEFAVSFDIKDYVLIKKSIWNEEVFLEIIDNDP